jgi:hypothetical protein
MCLRTVSDAFRLRGISTDADAVCGLGPRIRVSYQCAGRESVLQIMQSPGFNDVVGSCGGPLSLDITCKTCLDYGIVYLHRLVGSDDSVALSVCRNAVFVTLATQEGVRSTDDIVKCFFGVQGITAFSGIAALTAFFFNYRHHLPASQLFFFFKKKNLTLGHSRTIICHIYSGILSECYC